MRFGRLRIAGTAAGGWLAASFAGSGAAAAGEAQFFPVQQHFVPAVVAASFILPALAAGCLSAMRRLGRSRGAILGGGLLVIGLAALAAYAPPSLLAAIGI